MRFPRRGSTEVLGICTGLLAAAAVASAPSLTSLIPLAVQALRIAFRLGSRVAAIGDQLDSQKDRQKTWATIVMGISHKDAESAIAEFNKERVSFVNFIKGPVLINLRDWFAPTRSSSVLLALHQSPSAVLLLFAPSSLSQVLHSRLFRRETSPSVDLTTRLIYIAQPMSIGSSLQISLLGSANTLRSTL